MSLKDRIRRLEGRDGPGCPECRRRPASIHVVYPEEEYHEPEPERCPKCDRLIERCIIKVVYDG